MAQLVERLVRNEEASGSNPLISTKKKETASAVSFFMPNSQGSGYHSRHRRVIISRQRDYHFRFCEFVMIIHRVQMIASVAYMIVCKATVITRSARIIFPTPPCGNFFLHNYVSTSIGILNFS